LKKKPILKILIHLLIIASWLGIMFLLVEKEGLIKIKTGEVQFRTMIPEDIQLDIWKGIFINDQWIGYVHTMLGRNNLNNSKGYTVHSFSFLKFKMFNQLTGLAINALQELDSEFRMINFNVRVLGIADIFFKGKRLGDKVYLDIYHDRNRYSKVFDVGDDLFLEQSILSIYRGKGLKIGDSYTLNILNPLTINAEQIRVEVVGKDEDNLIMETKFAGLTSRSWIDQNGVVIREETPNGWVMKRVSEEAIDQYLIQSKSSAVDILRETSVRSKGEVKDPRHVKSLLIKVTGIDISKFSLDGTRQKIIDQIKSIVKISSVFTNPEEAMELPYRGNKLRKFLEPSTWIDCEDSQIKAKAAEIVGYQKNSWLAAQKISKWVFKNIDKVFSPGIPVATSVLLNKKGDCNEHTVLFIALARAAGIPAEMCAGLVYLNDGFYYHAWPKVFVGKWVHLDPTFGQPVADATHFELISGDFSDQTRIATTIGKIQIEILEAKD